MFSALEIRKIMNSLNNLNNADKKTLTDFTNFWSDVNSEITNTFLKGGTYIYRGINASVYNNFEVPRNSDSKRVSLLNDFIKYYRIKGFDVTVDSEEDDGDMIYYITISWKEVRK